MHFNELKSLTLATMSLSKAGLLGDPEAGATQPRNVNFYLTKDRRRRPARYSTGGWGGLAYYQVLEVIFNAAGMTTQVTPPRPRRKRATNASRSKFCISHRRTKSSKRPTSCLLACASLARLPTGSPSC